MIFRQLFWDSLLPFCKIFSIHWFIALICFFWSQKDQVDQRS